MSARRFAEDTKVPVSRTQLQLKERLQKAGADQVAVFESANHHAIAFRLGQSMFRLTVPADPRAKDQAQDLRRAWRLLALLTTAKLEAIRDGLTTADREFLADMLLYDGQTVGEWTAPQIEQARAEGRMPNQLYLEGPK